MPKASRTAVLVCQARAIADGRLAVGRFSDPVAYRLLDDDERGVVDMVRGPAPTSWRDRPTYAFLSATVEILTTRTVVIDDAVRERGHGQLVILGAGLDGRAWRMDSLRHATVFEVDQPASQAEKRRRAAQLSPVTDIVFVPVEFGVQSLREALATAGHLPDQPTTWIWEGVLPYLTDEQVRMTLTDVAALWAPGSQLIATYASRHTVGRPLHYALKALFAVTGHENPMASERHISSWTPDAMGALLGEFGFEVVADRDQRSIADELDVPSQRPHGLANGHVVVAEVPASD